MAAAAGSSRGRGRRKKCCSSGWWLWRAAAVAFLAGISPHCKDLFVHISGMEGAAVDVVRAGEQVISSAANATVAVTHLAVGAVSLSLSAAEDFWHGIDLLNAQANRTIGRADAESPAALKDWVMRGAGGLVPDVLLGQVARFVTNFNLSVPAQQGGGQHFEAEGAFRSWYAEVRRPRSGHIGFAVVVSTVAFQPKWSNPLWEMAEFTPASEPDRILAGVKLVIARLGEVDRYDMEVTDDNIRTDQLPLLPSPAQLPSSLSFKGSCTAVVLVLLGSLAAGLWLWRLRIRAAGAASN